jgi:hypothetical protein
MRTQSLMDLRPSCLRDEPALAGVYMSDQSRSHVAEAVDAQAVQGLGTRHRGRPLTLPLAPLMPWSRYTATISQPIWETISRSSLLVDSGLIDSRDAKVENRTFHIVH